MNIHLMHEIHGTKVAISEMEAEADEKNGWKRYCAGEKGLVLTPMVQELDYQHVPMKVVKKVPTEYAKKTLGRPKKVNQEVINALCGEVE